MSVRCEIKCWRTHSSGSRATHFLLTRHNTSSCLGPVRATRVGRGKFSGGKSLARDMGVKLVKLAVNKASVSITFTLWLTGKLLGI